MEETRPQPQNSESSLARQHFQQVESIVTLLEWLLVAFILALLFQGFGMQAFQIPTGSMAETLRGAHYRMRCFRCGYHFDTDTGSVSTDRAQCPNCSYQQPPHGLGDPKNGDRIFVLKSIYQFFEPKRWDVVVFKNPTDPKTNFIKRLIALPKEKVQLIKGDVYINDIIRRKPYNVQNELWMPIYLQDYQPFESAAHHNQLIQNGDDIHNQPWHLPFENTADSQWQITPAAFSLCTAPDREHTLTFQAKSPDEFRATYAYNLRALYQYKPMVTDLMIRFIARCDDENSKVGAVLEKNGILYSATVEMDGAIVLSRTVDGKTEELRRTLAGGMRAGTYEKFEFANVDQLLVLRWADKRVTYDLALDQEFLTHEKNIREVPLAQEKPPVVQITGTGSLDVRHVGLYRDIFYMGVESGDSRRATVDRPFQLEVHQFFVCGDNSNNSSDGRAWSIPGTGNNGIEYRPGIVPRDYMMGKAVLVYWSQAFSNPKIDLPLLRDIEVPMIPNFKNLKAISGSSEQEY
ncbi:MAG: signal peptidase I [Planctomycetota bacterium]|jgi:signal peptidase I